MSKTYELSYTAERIDEMLKEVDEHTIYSDATTEEHGLMSATDKAKLDALQTAQQIDDALNAKVDKVEGKGLSENDYTDTDKESVASAYHKPQNGIPKTDLDSSVKTSLDKANTALQSFTETDPTVPSWAKQSTKPSYDYSEIVNTPDLSGFITKSVNDLTNYYLKSETYTKAEVAALIGAIQQFHYEIYATLPQSGESNVLYLIGPTGSGSDKYEEYVYANNVWDKIGDTSIDLSGYVTTSALNTALADYTTTSNLTALLSNKADKVSNATNGNFAGLDANGNITDSGSKSTDFATAAQGAKADTAYQKPQTGIPESDLSSDVQQALQKHFKGWLESTADLPVNPVVGDYAYVKGATYTDPAAIYECTVAGSWSDSGRTADTSNVQTFASSQEVNEVHIVDDLTTGGIDDVLSAEQGVVLGNEIFGTVIKDLVFRRGYIHLSSGHINTGSYITNMIYSSNCIQNGYKIVLDDDYYIYDIWKFDSETATVGSEKILAGDTSTHECTIQNNGLFRVCVKRVDDGDFNFDSNNICTDNVEIGVRKKGLILDIEELEEDVEQITSSLTTKIDDEDLHLVFDSTNIFNAVASDGSENGILEGWLNSDFTYQSFPHYNWRTMLLYCSQYVGQKLTFGGSTIPNEARYAIYGNNNELLASNNFNKYTVPQTVLIPQGAVKLYATIARYSDDEYSQFRVNIGDLLLPYEEYKFKIDKIDGYELYYKSKDIDFDSHYHPVKLPINATLSPINFQFDWATSSTDNDMLVAELFESKGLRCGFALGVSNIADAEVVKKYRKLQNSGHSILNHPGSTKFIIDNFSTPQDAYDQIMIYQDVLQKQGFVTNGFVAPSSTFSSVLIDAVKSIFAYGATYNDSGNNTRTSNPCCTTRISMENITKEQLFKGIRDSIALNKIVSLYGHNYNFGTSGKNINITLTVVSVDEGTDTIVMTPSMLLNSGNYQLIIQRTEGSGDSEITVDSVSRGTGQQNILSVSGLTTYPSVGDKYTCVVDDEWNLTKLESIIDYCVEYSRNLNSVIMSPDDAYRYFFNL